MSECVVNHQRGFYSRGDAGCIFAKLAAKNPAKYGWDYQIAPVDPDEIDRLTHKAINEPEVTTLSLLFPTVHTFEQLKNLVETLGRSSNIFLEMDAIEENVRCLGFRARVGTLKSWIAGFGPFDFFEHTRQAPYTEMVFRVKPRPAYEWVMKESPSDVIHLADLHMHGLEQKAFVHIWQQTFVHTERILGHPPTLRNAAKTTFVIPVEEE